MCLRTKHGRHLKISILDESSDLAEGFKNDNPLAGSDNYEVYMTDVASQKKLVSLCGKP